MRPAPSGPERVQLTGEQDPLPDEDWHPELQLAAAELPGEPKQLPPITCPSSFLLTLHLPVDVPVEMEIFLPFPQVKVRLALGTGLGGRAAGRWIRVSIATR